jgi:hypothetical protein
MKLVVRLAIPSALVAVALLIPPSSGANSAMVCRGAIASTDAFAALTVRGDLFVPNGASCMLRNVVVDGNVFVDPAATFNLSAEEPDIGGLAGINGNLDAYGAAVVATSYADVTGNVVVVDARDVDLFKSSFGESGIFIGNRSLTMNFVGFVRTLMCINNRAVSLNSVGAAFSLGQCRTGTGL